MILGSTICMSNYRNIREGFGNFREYGTIETEVQYVARKMKCSVDEVLTAIQEVGVLDRDEIMEYIQDRSNRM